MVRQTHLALEIVPEQVSVFARHETFHPRFGWLKKGFDRASQDSGIFLRDDATVRLGVGKNMVRSIRYWCEAFKLLDSDHPTELGQQLLGHGGWDPYLEDPASLWLLHWQLLQPTCLATAWYFVFNHFHRTQFKSDELFGELKDYASRLTGRSAESSLHKDIACLLRMYARISSKSNATEDSLDCPFVELGLIHESFDGKYNFRIGSKHNLPASLVVYASLSYAATVSETARTLPLAKLLYDPGSPGMIFKLDELAICEAIERVSKHCNAVQVTDTAGKLQFVFNGQPRELATQILASYYPVRGA